MVEVPIQRLEDALRNAAQQGDEQAATRLAQEIRNRRAGGGQQVQSPALSAQVGPVDPLSNVPVEIGGVTLDDNLRSDIAAAREIEDPRERRLAVARISGRLAAQSPEGGAFDQLARSDFGAALRGFGAGLFGLGDVAAAGGTTLRGLFADDGEGLSFGEALEAQREFRRTLEEESGVLTTAAEVAGSLVAGGGVAAGLTRAAPRLASSLALQAGQRGRNVARLAGAGAASGAVTEGVTEGQAGEGALLGGIAGPLGAGLVRAAGVTTQAVRRFAQSPEAKGLRALASRLGESAEELGRRFLEFREVTGRPPTLTDITNPRAVAELRDLISETPGAVDIAREGAETALRRRPAEVAEQLTGGRVATTGQARRARRTAVAEELFGRAERDTIRFNRQQVEDIFENPDFQDAIRGPLRRRLGAALTDAGDGPLSLTGRDVNDLRLALRNRGGDFSGANRVFLDFINSVEDIASEQSPAFRSAIDQFRRRSLQAEGVDIGRGAIGARASEFAEQARQLGRGAEGAQSISGIRAGIRSGVSDRVLQGVSQARNVVTNLNRDSALLRNVQQALPRREVQRLQQVANIQSRALDNIRAIAPSVRAESDDTVQAAVRDAISGIVVAGGQTGGAFKAGLAQRILQRLTPRLSDDAAESLANRLFDPGEVPAVIAELRRQEVPFEDIIDLYTTSTAGGILAASNGGE